MAVTLTDTLVSGLAIAVGLGALVWILRFTLALSRDRELGRAARIATLSVTAGVGATLGAAASGLATMTEVLDSATAFIAMHPFAVTNVAGLGVGALGLSGAIELTPTAWLAGGAIFVFGALVISEVRN